MNIELMILGLIQGLTEFLPISSSGHLLLTKKLFGLNLPLAFDITLHLATLFAVILFCIPIIFQIMKAISYYLFKKKFSVQNQSQLATHTQAIHLLVFLIISTLVTAPIGLYLKKYVIDASLSFTGINFIITGGILLLPVIFFRKIYHSPYDQSKYSIPQIRLKDAIILGLVQGQAVFPGISRSGITISIGVLCGLSYSHATRYSFLMAIPAILASFVLSLADLDEILVQTSFKDLLVSLVLAFFTGLIALKLLSIIANKKKIWVFSIYLFLLGIYVLWIL